PRASRRAEITGSDVDSDVGGHRALHEQNVVGARGLIKRPRQVHDAAFDRQIAAERLEALVADVSVLNSRRSAARKRSGRSTTEASGRAAEVVDQGIVEVAGEFAGDADTRGAEILPGIEPLRRRRGRVRIVVVTADIPLDAARDGNAVLTVG